MPRITDPPPVTVAYEHSEIRLELDQVIPAKLLDYNLMLATWNIRAFGDLTEKWQSTKEDKPKRDLHALRLITEIVSRFDLVLIQGASGNLKALRHMLKLLGPEWGIILSDIASTSDRSDRLAFVFDTRRILLKGQVGEVSVPLNYGTDISLSAFSRNFARPPYTISFESLGQIFVLITLPIIYEYGPDKGERIPEMKALAKWLADWAKP